MSQHQTTQPEGMDQQLHQEVGDMPIDKQLSLVSPIKGDTVQEQLFGAAMATLVTRIGELDDEDRKDLSDCINEIKDCKTQDEMQDVLITIQEILSPQSSGGQELISQADVLKEKPREKFESWLVWVSRKLHDLRKQTGMTQKDLANKSGLPQSHISRLERGVHSPSNKTLEKIAAALGVDVGVFSLE